MTGSAPASLAAAAIASHAVSPVTRKVEWISVPARSGSASPGSER